MSNAPAPMPIVLKALQPIAFPGSSARTPLQPRLLLVEPEFDLVANRTLVLTGSNYSVTTVSSHNSVLKLHRDAGFSLAVLNDTLGLPTLRSVAACVRRKWPGARILILRRVESALEDYLYDETIDFPFPPKALLEALRKLVDNSEDQKTWLFGTNPGLARGSDAPLPFSPSTPLESDPTEADSHNLDAKRTYLPDLPGEEQGGHQGLQPLRLA